MSRRYAPPQAKHYTSQAFCHFAYIIKLVFRNSLMISFSSSEIYLDKVITCDTTSIVVLRNYWKIFLKMIFLNTFYFMTVSMFRFFKKWVYKDRYKMKKSRLYPIGRLKVGFIMKEIMCIVCIFFINIILIL